MTDRVIGQIEKRVNHVGVDAQEHSIFGPDHRCPILVPDVFRDLESGLSELGRCGVGVVVHPVPDPHVDEGHRRNLGGAPEIVEHLVRVTLGVGL